LLLFSPKLFAQEEEMQISKNAISLDLLVFDQTYSLNYERAFIVNKFAIVPKVGVYIHPYSLGQSFTYTNSASEAKTVNKSLNSVTLGTDFIYGKIKHFAELSLNMRLQSGFYSMGNRKPKDVLNYAFEPRIGYRFQPNKKGLFGRVLVRPLFIESFVVNSREGNRKRIFLTEVRGPRKILSLLTFGIGYSF
jgi:hypothetical protein